MRALCWNGVNDLRVETVADPDILNPQDIILKVRLTTTCGSDLHLIDGLIPTMREGDVLGHEFMGEIVDVGRDVTKVKRGDRVVVPSFIACGRCWYCAHDLYSLCDTSHPKPELQEPLLGYRRRASMPIPMPSAAMRAATPTMSACRLPIPTVSSCRTAWPTRMRCSSPMPRLPGSWARTFATSSAAT